VATVHPILVRVVEAAPTRELSFGGILLQALGLTGLVIVSSILLGAILGVLFVWLRARRPANAFNGSGSERIRLHLEPPARLTSP
jgi:ABC-type amino acid transport system permease subunit